MNENNKLLLCIIQQLSVTNMLLMGSCKNDDILKAAEEIQKGITEILDGMKDELQEEV